MHQTIGKLLPSDGYYVQLHARLLAEHYQVIYQLYQPLIGGVATSLYMTLLTEIESEKLETHHHLMQTMNQPLTDIYQARLKCEAIGLIRTFHVDDPQHTVYCYQLNLPCLAHQFFADDVLNQLLYHQLGDQQYQRLTQQLLDDKSLQNPQDAKDITVGFTDIFSSIKSQDQNLKQQPEQIPTAVPNLDDVDVDWAWLKQVFEARMLPVQVIFSETNKHLIKQMTGLYGLSTTQLEKAIQWSLTSDHQLDKNEFMAACLDLTEILPVNTMVTGQKDKIQQAKTEKVTSKQSQFIERMETISPKELLEDLSNGNRASRQDLKMIASVMEAQGLTPGVMNVLIHYVMLKTDMKLTKSYLEKIASHWARKNVKTVQQAMTLAKSEHNKYQQWRQSPKPNYTKPASRKEVVPDWFKEQKKAQAKKVTEATNTGQDVSELLKAFKQDRVGEQR
ncbi:replication initiation and membrane attachment family protein [Amphibacillus sediminis]|uniref:replication initiation and membrane attachment family protein n=1 Tax=Amphibacillus sediminis TaxID=360185 RepID=UPI00082C4D06|nr:DnaD domain protein [Amphibacillus sediminis]